MIGPGVKVIFQGHYKLEVEGQLLAMGNKNDSILFTVNDTLGFSNRSIANGSWNGMIINQISKKNIFFSHCVFEYAKGLDDNAGGAIELKKLYGPVEIRNCAFRNNMSYAGGALFYYGLGSSASLLITIKGCSFKNNSARNRGGALSISSFGALKELSNCTFIHNTAGSTGGAVSIEAADKLSNCLFKNNSAIISGGAIWSGVSTSLNVYNSIFDHNSAGIGAAYYANMGVYSGLYNCTLINNISTHSSVYTGTNTVAEFSIVNSIVWNPESPEVIISSPTTRKTVENSIIRNAKDTTWFSATCLDVNPLLSVDKFTEYAPLEGSPCIDNGNNSYLNPAIVVDFKNNCRIWDGKNTNSKTVDIGAIEYNSVDSLPAIKNNSENTILCEGSPLTLEVSTTKEDNKYNYQWFFNNQPLTGSSSSYSINPTTISNSGYYFCRINNKYGEVESNMINVLVNQTPDKPSKPFGLADTITNIADSSVYKISKIENSQTIEWELSPSALGEIFYNDTMAIIKWKNTFQGVASLVVKHSNQNCYSLSDTLKIIVERDLNAVQEQQSTLPVIYPNPSSGSFYIDLTGTGIKKLNILITDDMGRVVRKESIRLLQPIIHYTMPKGLYHVTLINDDKLLSTKRIVVN